MRCVHGSAQKTIAQTGFSLFNYQADTDGKPSGVIGSGLDCSGPGIYAFPAEGPAYKEALENGAGHAGRGGVVYVLDVDVDPAHLAHNREADEIPIELWAKVVEEVISRRRHEVGYDEAALRALLQPYADRIDSGETVKPSEVARAIANYECLNLDYYDPAVADDGTTWIEAVIDDYAINYDPCSDVMVNGGPIGIATYAIGSSEDLWETLFKIWNACAVEVTGVSTNTYNKTFQDAVLATLPEEHSIPGAIVNGGRFLLVFDTSLIRITRQIDYDAINDRESEHAPAP